MSSPAKVDVPPEVDFTCPEPFSPPSYTSSHSRTVLSLLPDATIRPSGLKHTERTIPPCPSSVLTRAFYF